MANNNGKVNGNAAIAAKVVDRILELVNSGESLPWVKPWNRKPNTITVVDGYKTISCHPTAWNRQGKPYNGVNTYLPYGEYITFNQCKEEGGKVKKGAKGFPVVYWNFQKKVEIDENGEEHERTIPFLKYYTVFNIEDCEGLEQKNHPEDITITIPISHVVDNPDSPELIPAAEAIINDYIANNKGFDFYNEEVSDRAYYSPASDCVHVPNHNQFADIAEYYSTAFHEIGHSTGHSTRLNRFTGNAKNAAFGSEEYSREELVAESTAATLLNMLGLENGNSFRNSAAYIKSWSSHIKDDPMMFITAMTRAQAAVNYILGIEAEKENGVA